MWRSRDRHFLDEHPGLAAARTLLLSSRQGLAFDVAGALDLALPRGVAGDITPLTALSALSSARVAGIDLLALCRRMMVRSSAAEWSSTCGMRFLTCIMRMGPHEASQWEQFQRP